MLNKNSGIRNRSFPALCAVFVLTFLMVCGRGVGVQQAHAESHNFMLDLVLVQISTASYSCYNENYIMIENSLDVEQSLDNLVIDVMGTLFPLDGLTIPANDSHTYFLPITLNLFDQIQQQPVFDGRSDYPTSNAASLMYLDDTSNGVVMVAQATSWSSHSAGQMVCETFIDEVAVGANDMITSITLRHEDFEDVNLLAADFIARHFEAAVDEVVIAFGNERMPFNELDYVILPAPDGEPTVQINMSSYDVSSTDPLQLMAMHPVTGEQILLDTVQAQAAGFGSAVPLAVGFTQQGATASVLSILALSMTILLTLGTAAIVRK